MFITSLAFYCVFIFASATTHLTYLVYHEERKFIEAIYQSPPTIFVCGICFLSMWSILGLSVFHTYLTVGNQTTNEDVRLPFFYPESNAFPTDQRVLCGSTCCRGRRTERPEEPLQSARRLPMRELPRRGLWALLPVGAPCKRDRHGGLAGKLRWSRGIEQHDDDDDAATSTRPAECTIRPCCSESPRPCPCTYLMREAERDAHVVVGPCDHSLDTVGSARAEAGGDGAADAGGCCPGSYQPATTATTAGAVPR